MGARISQETRARDEAQHQCHARGWVYDSVCCVPDINLNVGRGSAGTDRISRAFSSRRRHHGIEIDEAVAEMGIWFGLLYNVFHSGCLMGVGEGGGKNSVSHSKSSSYAHVNAFCATARALITVCRPTEHFQVRGVSKSR